MSIVPYPTLLLKPDGSHDRNGPVSPELSGAVRVVEGQHGPAWFVEEGTTNYIENPRGEPGGAIWGGSTQWTQSQDTTLTIDGIPSIKREVITAYTGSLYFRNYSSSDNYTGGETVTYSVKMRASRSRNMRISVFGRDDAENLISLHTPVYYDIGPDAWTPVEITTTLPAGVTDVQAFMYANGPDQVVGDTFWFCQPQLEKKPYATSYCDGSLGTGYSWAGTAHASASTRASGRIMVEPDGRLMSAEGSVAARFVAGGNAFYRRIFMAGHSGAVDSDALSLYVHTSHGFFGQWRSGNGVDRMMSSGETVVPGERHNAYGEWSGQLLQYGLDGDMPGSLTRDTPIGSLKRYLAVGTTHSGSQPINGSVAPLAFFDRPLTQSERDELFAMDSWEWNDFVPKFGGVSISVPDDPILVNVSVPEPVTVNAPVPTLVMAPGDSRDQNGAVSPTLTGGVLEVMTDQGPAWQIAEATTNAFINPSMVTRDNWLAYHGTFAPLPIDTLEAPSEIGGGRMLSVYRGPEVSSDVVSFTIAATTIGTGIPSGLADLQLPFPPSSSSKATISMWMLIDEYTPHPAQYLRAAFTLTFYDANGGVLTSYGRTDLYMDPDVGAWKKLNETFDLPAGTEKFRFSVGVIGAATARVRISQPQIEAKPYATPYCDGSLGPGHTWAGTAHASASSRAGSRLLFPSADDFIDPYVGSLVVGFRLPGKPVNNANFVGIGGYNSGKDNMQLRVESGKDRIGTFWQPGSGDWLGMNYMVALGEDEHIAYHGWNGTYTETDVDGLGLQTRDRREPLGDISGQTLAVGSYPPSSTSVTNGLYTHVAFFPRLLTTDERAALFAAGPVRMHDFIAKLGGVLVTPGGN